MKRPKQLQLLRRLVHLLDNPEAEAEAAGFSIPASWYLSEDRLAAEKVRVFRRMPLLIAHGSELAEAGDFLTVRVLGLPLLAVRGVDGVARVFHNRCRHRGAVLVEAACGKARNFVCPYHAWSYGMRGELLGVPKRKAFLAEALEGRNLQEIACEERHGFFVDSYGWGGACGCGGALGGRRR